jgi:23S rRNA (guanine1835-N2)-methyltransferase
VYLDIIGFMDNADAPYKIPSGLKRYPYRKEENLYAWDSSDELIIGHMGQIPDLKGKRILILNDSFGALSCALEGLDVTTYTDSYVGAKALEVFSQNRLKALPRLQDLSGLYDFALIHMPKNMSFFEDLLCHLSGHLHSESKIICGYMMKYHNKTSFDLLNQYVGETSTSLARKKARLIFADFQKAQVPSPYPLSVRIEAFDHPFIHHSNLFSREKLDIGTRFLLEHLPQGNYKTILDLGCANGVVGIAAKLQNPAARIIFSDESNMAIQSARANYENYFPQSDTEARFLWINCYENQEAESVDLVLCNPPFHQGNALGDFTAWQMFTDSYRTLTAGGVLRVIGNSHLRYPSALKKIFGNTDIIATNEKFTIVDAYKN